MNTQGSSTSVSWINRTDLKKSHKHEHFPTTMRNNVLLAGRKFKYLKIYLSASYQSAASEAQGILNTSSVSPMPEKNVGT